MEDKKAAAEQEAERMKDPANRLEDPNADDREYPTAGQSVPPAEDDAGEGKAEPGAK